MQRCSAPSSDRRHTFLHRRCNRSTRRWKDAGFDILSSHQAESGLLGDQKNTLRKKKDLKLLLFFSCLGFGSECWHQIANDDLLSPVWFHCSFCFSVCLFVSHFCTARCTWSCTIVYTTAFHIFVWLNTCVQPPSASLCKVESLLKFPLTEKTASHTHTTLAIKPKQRRVCILSIGNSLNHNTHTGFH